MDTTEITGGKLPIRSGYKETVVTWLNPECQAMSNNNVPVTAEINIALDIIKSMNHNAELDRILNGYTQKTAPRTAMPKGEQEKF